MPNLGKRIRTLESHANPLGDDQVQPKNLSSYEQFREERIRENRERLHKLSLKFKALAPPKQTQINPSDHKSTDRPTLPSSGSLRRSSRLQNVTPLSYSEALFTKKDRFLEDDGVFLEEGAKPEVYTEDHEKLLGNTDKNWTLFVDGYEDGRRVYDGVKGKTCHQCRQKTLGHRTHCIKCNLVQGQFCGDCLYMRYGEHVLEAIQNTNWICPVCRGICNCSLCRQAKGWPPTGRLYKKIANLGFKSVAHYLIQTRRAQSNLGENPDTTNQVSAKRSLPFSDMEVLSKESLKVDDTHLRSLMPQSEDKKDDEFESVKENELKSSPNAGINNQVSAKRLLPFSDMEAQSENTKSSEVEHGHLGLKPQFEDKRNDESSGEKEKKLHFIDKENGDSNMALESCPILKKKFEPSPDSIAGRLRRRNKKGDGCVNELSGVNEKTSDAKQVVNNNSSEEEVKKEKEMEFINKKQDDSNIAQESGPRLKKKPSLNGEPSPDSIAGRLRQRQRKGNGCDDELPGDNEKTLDVKQAVNNILSEKEVAKKKEMYSTENKHAHSNIALENSSKLKKKRALATEPSPDSIAGRLRQRHRMGMNEKILDAKLVVNNISSEKEAEKEREMHSTDNKHGDSNIALESSQKA